jgi:hypothetical protein
MKKTIITEELNNDGVLIKRITETIEEDDKTVDTWKPYIPYIPYPSYPNTGDYPNPYQPVTYGTHNKTIKV